MPISFATSSGEINSSSRRLNHGRGAELLVRLYFPAPDLTKFSGKGDSVSFNDNVQVKILAP